MRRKSECWLCVLLFVFHSVAFFAQVCRSSNCPPSDSDKAAHLRFDVISVKSADPRDERWHLDKTPDGVSAGNVTLKKLIEEAFGIWDDGHLLGSPAWIDKERFGVEARVDDEDLERFKSANRAQLQSMLQDILVNRFSLKAHYEQREDSVLVLKTVKDGSKLVPSVTPGEGQPKGSLRVSDTPHLRILRCPMESLARFLSSRLGQRVIDETGLPGRYDVKLDLDTHEGDAPATSIDLGASIISALKEQLGLRLEAAKRPVPYLVIDSVSRPDEN